MARQKKKSETEELNDILFDTLGDFISPGSWEITPREGKTTLVFCRQRPPSESLVKQAYDDIERRLKGTRFENKVTVLFPAD